MKDPLSVRLTLMPDCVFDEHAAVALMMRDRGFLDHSYIYHIAAAGVDGIMSTNVGIEAISRAIPSAGAGAAIWTQHSGSVSRRRDGLAGRVLAHVSIVVESD